MLGEDFCAIVNPNTQGKRIKTGSLKGSQTARSSFLQGGFSCGGSTPGVNDVALDRRERRG